MQTLLPDAIPRSAADPRNLAKATLSMSAQAKKRLRGSAELAGDAKSLDASVRSDGLFSQAFVEAFRGAVRARCIAGWLDSGAKGDHDSFLGPEAEQEHALAILTDFLGTGTLADRRDRAFSRIQDGEIWGQRLLAATEQEKAKTSTQPRDEVAQLYEAAYLSHRLLWIARRMKMVLAAHTLHRDHLKTSVATAIDAAGGAELVADGLLSIRMLSFDPDRDDEQLARILQEAAQERGRRAHVESGNAAWGGTALATREADLTNREASRRRLIRIDATASCRSLVRKASEGDLESVGALRAELAKSDADEAETLADSLEDAERQAVFAIAPTLLAAGELLHLATMDKVPLPLTLPRTYIGPHLSEDAS